jgi:anti-sigma factor RsiW
VADDGVPGNGLGAAHAEHDAELVAALVDRDLAEADQAAGAELIESCAACRALLGDLRALATAMADLPIPARARDFTLTPETAARISAVPAGEPLAAGARLTGEMIHSTPKHETHDRLLVASLVDRTISDTERARAEAQLTGCTACAQLHEELVALAAATRALPVPARTRDFTLTPAEAARLRGSPWRRLIAAIGSTRDVFSRPLAIGLTTLGVAGLLVATVPMPFMAGGATAERALAPIGAATEDSTARSAPGDDFAAQSSAAPLPGESGPAMAATGPSAEPSGVAEAAPEDLEPDVLFQGGETSPLPGEPDANRNLYQTGFDTSGSGPSPMFIVAGLLLLMGLGLFGLRWTARRLGDG